MTSGTRGRRPRLAKGVRLCGELQGAGFAGSQWLIEREGRYIQLTELLYRVAEQTTGGRTLEQIAESVSERTGRTLTGDHVRYILATKLAPLGLVARTEGSPASVRTQQLRSPLTLNLRMKTIGPELIDPIARLLQVFYAPPVLVVALAAIAGAHAWMYLAHDVDSSVRATLRTPALLLVVIAVSQIAGLFHEFGHAAGLRYGGGRARAMGAGLYLVYPAFYTDTTDSYRLGRWARLRTDLGGFYFHLLFAAALVGLYVLTGQEVLLLAAFLIDVDVLYQSLPFVRFDGYWAFADLTGLPDLFAYAGPFIRSLLPGGQSRANRLPRLRPWVQAAFAGYLLLSVPVLGVLFGLMVVQTPVLVESTLDTFIQLTSAFGEAWQSGDFVSVIASAIQIGLLALPPIGVGYLLFSVARQAGSVLRSWAGPALPRRALSGCVAIVGVGLVLWSWAPEWPYLVRVAPADTLTIAVLDRNHVTTPAEYAEVPPVGGNHAPIWQNCGAYAEPVPNEQAVHSLEHGAVWITYRPDLPPDDVTVLRQLATSRSYVLASPYPELRVPLVASAWGRQLVLDSPRDPRLVQFVGAFRLGPQAPERGGPCTGGRGTPDA